MCANAHSPLRSPYDLGHFGVWALLKPMELDHLTLAVRELLQGDVEELGALPKLERHEICLRSGPGVDLE